ncbi:hypothetical protein, partial [Klebsiella pneumoniae]|uniref:hypothetical protein n=1 Tax=Klebsiella pneumoniae TaxID=573 RepID=UPI003013AEAD
RNFTQITAKSKEIEPQNYRNNTLPILSIFIFIFEFPARFLSCSDIAPPPTMTATILTDLGTEIIIPICAIIGIAFSLAQWVVVSKV